MQYNLASRLEFMVNINFPGIFIQQTFNPPSVISYCTSRGSIFSISQNQPYLSFQSSYHRALEKFYFTTDFLDDILELRNEAKDLSYKHAFNSLDARRAFFHKTAQALEWLYLNIAFQLFVFRVSPDTVPDFHELFDASEITHIENLYWLDKRIHPENKRFVDSYLKRIKIHIIFDVWSCFESSLQSIYESIVPEVEKKKLKTKRFSEFDKKLKNLKYEIELFLQKEAKNPMVVLDERHLISKRLDSLSNFAEKELSDVYMSVDKKWSAIYKIIKEKYFYCSRNRHGLGSEGFSEAKAKALIESDKSFLRLLNDVRNTTHFNGVSLKDKCHVTRIGTFYLKSNEPVNFVSEEFVLKAIRELVQIYYSIVYSIVDFEPVIYESAYSLYEE